MDIHIQSDEAGIDELLQLINSAYRGTEGAGRWTTEEHLVEGDRISRAGLSAMIADPSTVLFVGKKDGMMAACIAVKWLPDAAEFGAFAVAPHLHGQGLGKIMLAHAEANARGRRKQFQVCVVNQNTKLLQFYLKRGYQDQGIVLDYPMAEEVGVPKRPGLCLKLLSKSA